VLVCRDVLDERDGAAPLRRVLDRGPFRKIYGRLGLVSDLGCVIDLGPREQRRVVPVGDVRDFLIFDGHAVRYLLRE